MTGLALVVGLAALFVAMALVAAFVLGLATKSQRPEERMRRRLSIYTLRGRPEQPVPVAEPTSRLGDSAVARTAVEFADRMVERQDLDDVIGSRLEAAGIPLRTAEWMLMHTGMAAATGILFMALPGNRLAAGIVGVVIGMVGPWLFLSLRQDRRQAAFLSQLPDTLQLLAGSLRAGYSMPQAIDTVTREGQPPMSGEFNRALVETRLGVDADTALQGVADRMKSQDFAWVVMAIRIQRDVGGNLAELLTTVADTMRERERLARHVRSLSAEGRLSAWILGLMPVAFAGYLLISRPTYIRVLFVEQLGQLLLLMAVVLLAVGALWLRKVVRVEV
jgi:tight adherence protein B